MGERITLEQTAEGEDECGHCGGVLFQYVMTGRGDEEIICALLCSALPVVRYDVGSSMQTWQTCCFKICG